MAFVTAAIFSIIKPVGTQLHWIPDYGGYKGCRRREGDVTGELKNRAKTTHCTRTSWNLGHCANTNTHTHTYTHRSRPQVE